jgi:hypothetical protein
MHPDDLQAISERDQLWASLQALLPEIEQLARGEFGGSERECRLLVLMARIVAQELRFRAALARPEETEPPSL